MGSSGLIVAFLVALWAAYFVPLVLRRYDEAGRDSALDTPGPRRRVVAQAAQPQATRPQPTQVAQPTQPAQPQPTMAPQSVPTRPVQRRAAAIAARRRRRVLFTLTGLLLVVSGLAIGGLLPVLSIAAPVALIVAWLFACRFQVRSERSIGRSRTTSRTMAQRHSILSRISWPSIKLPKLSSWNLHIPAVNLDRFRATSSGTSTAETNVVARRRGGVDSEDTIIVAFDEVEPDRAHVMERNAPLPADALNEQLEIAVPTIGTSGEALWEPLPVTVPTYVNKPRVGRTVRTIDFNSAGAWTSGHVEGEDIDYPSREAGHDDGEHQRAVGH